MEDRQSGQAQADDREAIVKILDSFASGGESRMKVEMSEVQEAGTFRKACHHGRCDIGSPWASGECFDAPETACDTE